MLITCVPPATPGVWSQSLEDTWSPGHPLTPAGAPRTCLKTLPPARCGGDEAPAPNPALPSDTVTPRQAWRGNVPPPSLGWSCRSAEPCQGDGGHSGGVRPLPGGEGRAGKAEGRVPSSGAPCTGKQCWEGPGHGLWAQWGGGQLFSTPWALEALPQGSSRGATHPLPFAASPRLDLPPGRREAQSRCAEQLPASVGSLSNVRLSVQQR